MGLRFNSRALSPILFLTLIISSCGQDLSAVERFGKLSEQVKETSIGVSDDIYDSCVRSINFIYLDAKDDPIRTRSQREESCTRESKPTAELATSANFILIDYIESLGRLANNQIASPTQSIGDFGKALKQLNIPLGDGKSFQFKPTDVDAGTKIATFLANALTNRFRRDKIKSTVLCTNDDIKTYTSGLEAMVEDGYLGVLAIEKRQVRGYYTSLITELQVNKGSPLDFDNLRDKLSRDVGVIQQKESDTRAYVSVLRRTAKAHQDLYNIFIGEGRSQISSTELAGLCKNFFVNTKDNQISNSKTILKPDEARAANEIILQYEEDIKHLTRKAK